MIILIVVLFVRFILKQIFGFWHSVGWKCAKKFIEKKYDEKRKIRREKKRSTEKKRNEKILKYYKYALCHNIFFV